jgi:hypothetical protein
VGLNPVLDSFLQLLDERGRLDTEPSDVDLVAHLANGVFDFGKEGNLLVKDFETRIASDDLLEDLLRHVVKVESLFFNASVFAIFSGAGALKLLAKDFLERISRV